MVADYNSKGERTVMFNAVECDFSTLIEAVELVLSMAVYKDSQYGWYCRNQLLKR